MGEVLLNNRDSSESIVPGDTVIIDIHINLSVNDVATETFKTYLCGRGFLNKYVWIGMF